MHSVATGISRYKITIARRWREAAFSPVQVRHSSSAAPAPRAHRTLHSSCSCPRTTSSSKKTDTSLAMNTASAPVMIAASSRDAAVVRTSIPIRLTMDIVYIAPYCRSLPLRPKGFRAEMAQRHLE